MFVFFFNDTATTEIYTLSLHDALPISYATLNAADSRRFVLSARAISCADGWLAISGSISRGRSSGRSSPRSEEHTSELQSRQYLVCRLLLEKKKILQSSLFQFLPEEQI